MKIYQSKVEKTVSFDMGKFRHMVTYTADDTNLKQVVIKSLEDNVLSLLSTDVVKEPKGTLAYKEGQIMAEEMSVCQCFKSIVDDLKAIISAIEKGEQVAERPFPVEEQIEEDNGIIEET